MRRMLSLFGLTTALLMAPRAIQAQKSGARAAESDSRERGAELPRPFSAFSESAQSLRDSIVALARAQIGKRYVYGGESPSRGFDCSGLVQYVAAALQIRVPRTARLQARVGDAIPADTSRLLPGDVLTFGSGKSISHVGIYVGDGRMVHASTAAGRVIETKLLRPRVSGIKPWRGARRLEVAVRGDSLQR